jgi:hypothetical protein
MYEIISDGQIVSLCDNPRYIKVKPSTGCFIQTTAEEAQGVSAGGKPYNLSGHTEITVINYDEETKTSETVPAPIADVREVDGSEVVFAEFQRTDNNTTKIAEVDDTALASLEAATDLYEQLLDKGVLD